MHSVYICCPHRFTIRCGFRTEKLHEILPSHISKKDLSGQNAKHLLFNLQGSLGESIVVWKLDFSVTLVQFLNMLVRVKDQIRRNLPDCERGHEKTMQKNSDGSFLGFESRFSPPCPWHLSRLRWSSLFSWSSFGRSSLFRRSSTPLLWTRLRDRSLYFRSFGSSIWLLTPVGTF